MIHPRLLDLLRCPQDQSKLRVEGNELVSEKGSQYPIVQGVPVLLNEEMGTTLHVEEESLKQARKYAEGQRDGSFVDTLGISEEEKDELQEANDSGAVDPVVAYLVGATSGIAYKNAIGSLKRVPIPELRLPSASKDQLLLDVGCNWGRWCLAAEKKGYTPVGLDPSLGAVLAAKRLATQRGIEALFVVGDARFLPFRPEIFDVIFSYSVLQHFSEENVRRTLSQIHEALRGGGRSKIQMAAKYGVRSLYHQLKRSEAPKSFDVRYWSPSQLKQTFERYIGPTELEVDCYFGLGLQPTDTDMMSPLARWATQSSEKLRVLSQSFTPLKRVADSLYLNSRKNAP
jgi:SAM-dependent methyltransferase/uncharacterized protein YbaR (Trm112 family)